MAWRITFDGEVYREGDLTIGQAEVIEKETGLTWRQLNPLRSAACASAILAVCHSDRTGVSLEDARTKVRALRIDDFNVEPDEDDLPSEFEAGFPPVADVLSTAT